MSNALYKTEEAELLADKCNQYFDYCDDKGSPYSVPGLAYYLGFDSRNSVARLAKKEEFRTIIKRAKLRIEIQRNEQLISDKGSSRGKEFDLTNNFGWKNVQNIEHGGKVDLVARMLKGNKRVEELPESEEE